MGQHWSLRLRDPGQVAGGELQDEDKHQAAGGPVHLEERQEHHPARREVLSTLAAPWDTPASSCPPPSPTRFWPSSSCGTTPRTTLWACTCSPRSWTRRSPSPTLAPSTSTSPSSPRSRATTLVCPRRDPSSLSTTATKRRMTRNRKIHPDNPNSIFLSTKKKKTYNMWGTEGRPDALSQPTPKNTR